MTRRSVIRLLLSLLLLMSQQMALSHSVTHWRMAPALAEQRGGGDANLSKALAQDQWCDQCLAFAQIAGSVGSDSRAFAPFNPGADAIAAKAERAFCPRTVCAFRSRAPPVLA
jgi:hypothetical protein